MSQKSRKTSFSVCLYSVLPEADAPGKLWQKNGSKGDLAMIIDLWTFFVALLQISPCERVVVNEVISSGILYHLM